LISLLCKCVKHKTISIFDYTVWNMEQFLFLTGQWFLIEFNPTKRIRIGRVDRYPCLMVFYGRIIVTLVQLYIGPVCRKTCLDRFRDYAVYCWKIHSLIKFIYHSNCFICSCFMFSFNISKFHTNKKKPFQNKKYI
jgi:hypothetical protein